MHHGEPGPMYDEILVLLQRALMLCDNAEIGRTAAPHLNLALNLLLAEYQTSRAPVPVPE